MFKSQLERGFSITHVTRGGRGCNRTGIAVDSDDHHDVDYYYYYVEGDNSKVNSPISATTRRQRGTAGTAEIKEGLVMGIQGRELVFYPPLI